MLKREVLIEELSKLDDQTLIIAYAYATNLMLFGVDVTEEWDTAVRQAEELHRAYICGLDDGYKKCLARGQFVE